MNYYTYTDTLKNASIISIDENAAKLFIPLDPENLEYQAFLKWVAEGNTPEEYDPPA
jgi:hypothetical protein